MLLQPFLALWISSQLARAARATADLDPKTLETYCQSVRKIVSDLLELPDDGARYDYRGTGRAEWLAKVGAVKLSWLTTSRLAAWKKSFLASAGADPLSQGRVRISANFFLRNARSLFSAKIRRNLSLTLPDPLPFAGVEIERPTAKYYSSFDLAKLTQAAAGELANSDPEAFKVFLLSAMAGLRRKEIDLLPWTAFRWNQSTIRIEPTHHFRPETADSSGDVTVDPEFMAVFRDYLDRDPYAQFVINSELKPRQGVTYNYYRCEAVFDRLSQWLRTQGIKSAKPIHEMRKAFGSAICQKAGIHQASRSLRHSDIRVTSQVYVDSRSRISIGLGTLLKRDLPHVSPHRAPADSFAR